VIDLSMLGIKSSATPNIKMQKAGARRELLLLRFLAASDLGVGPSRYAADSTAQDYHQAVFIRPLNTIADPAPSSTAMPDQHQLHSF